MSELIRKFEYDGNSITTTEDGDEIWFFGKEVCDVLGYQRADNAIRNHTKKNERRKLTHRISALGQSRLVYQINEPGLYRLVFSSKLESAEKFKTWVFSVVLPSIRKIGKFTIEDQLSIMSETDLHYKVIEYIKKYHSEAIVVPSLGEHQDSSQKRTDGWKKGYVGGQPDILIINCNKRYNGLAIELKTPKGCGKLSDKQKSYLSKLEAINYIRHLRLKQL